MKIKAACIGTPESLVEALSGTEFAAAILTGVIGECLGVSNVLERPAEYYLQNADIGPAPKAGVMGVEVRLTGASRTGRAAKQFHNALKVMKGIVEKTVAANLPDDQQCQIFCVIMADGEVENPPGSGHYSTSIESDTAIVVGKAERVQFQTQ